jgi:predicted chitinase
MSQSTGDSRYAAMLIPEPGNRYYGRGFFRFSSPADYQRVAEITGEPIYDNPDLLLAPDISARVLFASI